MNSWTITLLLLGLLIVSVFLVSKKLEIAYTYNIIKYFELTNLRIPLNSFLGYLLLSVYLLVTYFLVFIFSKRHTALLLSFLLLLLMAWFEKAIVPLDPSFISLVLFLTAVLFLAVAKEIKTNKRLQQALYFFAAIASLTSYFFWPLLGLLPIFLFTFDFFSENSSVKRKKYLLLSIFLATFAFISLLFNVPLITKLGVVAIAIFGIILMSAYSSRLTSRALAVLLFIVLFLETLLLKSYLIFTSSNLSLPIYLTLVFVALFVFILENSKLPKLFYLEILLLILVSLSVKQAVAPILLLLPLLVPRLASIETKLELTSYIGYGSAIFGLLIVLLMTGTVPSFAISKSYLVLPSNLSTLYSSQKICSLLSFYHPSIHCIPIEYWKYPVEKLINKTPLLIDAKDLNIKIFDVAIPIRANKTSVIYLLVKSKVYLKFDKTLGTLYYTTLTRNVQVGCAVINNSIIQVRETPICFVKVPGAFLVIDKNNLSNPYVQILVGLKFINYKTLYANYPNITALLENNLQSGEWYKIITF